MSARFGSYSADGLPINGSGQEAAPKQALKFLDVARWWSDQGSGSDSLDYNSRRRKDRSHTKTDVERAWTHRYRDCGTLRHHEQEMEMREKESTISAPSGTARRPGRPGSLTAVKDQTRDAMLDVAEQLFSESGYAATSFRDIAADAEVNPALISYYFGTKRLLFEAVYKRRVRELTDRWNRLLDELESRPGRAPTVEELLRAYLLPQFEVKHSSKGGMAFVRLQTRLHSEADEVSFALRREVYDAVGRRFIAALERSLPNLDAADVNWRYIFIIGAGLYMIGDVDRLSDLSSDRFDSKDPEEVLERLLRFCVGGITAAPTQSLPKRIPKKRGSSSAGKIRARSTKAATIRRR
jgi:AcrR family transcriptional regulator